MKSSSSYSEAATAAAAAVAARARNVSIGKVSEASSEASADANRDEFADSSAAAGGDQALDLDELEFYIDEDGDDIVVEDVVPRVVAPNADFDEKDELLLEVPLTSEANTHRKKSLDTILAWSDLSVAPPAMATYRSPPPPPLQPQLYHQQEDMSTFDLLDKLDFDERVIAQLPNVSCLCDLNTTSSTKDSSVNINGRLVLTNFRLQFMPYYSDDAIDLSRIFTIERSLLLFNTRSSQLAVFIPLTFIFDIRASKTFILASGKIFLK